MSYDSLLGYAIQFVDVEKIINHYLPGWKAGTPIDCPFHTESQPSLSLDLHLKNGVIGQCFGCGEKIKHVWDLCRKAEGKGSWRKWAEYWYKECVPILSMEIVQRCSDALGHRTDCMAYLTGPLRGLSEETIREYQIGYDKNTNRITIPIFDLLGNCVNIRKFKWQKDQKGPKAISHGKGFGETRLFPERLLSRGKFYLVEGEWDALVLNQNGLPAASWTCGTLSWSSSYNLLLEDKELLVRYDDDHGGKKGEAVVQSHLDTLAKQGTKVSYRIVPPPPNTKGKDISEWVNNNDSAITHFKHEFKQKKVVILPPTYNEIHNIFHETFYIEDPYYIDTVFATLIANQFRTDRIWNLIVGPPGSLKTEVVRSSGHCTFVKEISELTAQTLISGFRGKKGDDHPKSLLLRMPNGTVVVYKEFNSVLNAPYETRQKLFEQFRRIHDGKVEAGFGTGLEQDWEGHIGFLGCCTNLVDGSISLQTTLGDRFILYRLFVKKRKFAAHKAIENLPKTNEIRKYLLDKVSRFLDQFADPVSSYIEPSKADRDRLVELAETIAYGRAGVQKHRMSGSGSLIISAEPIPEIPTRIVRTLTLLGQGLAFIRGLKKFDDFIWNVLTKVTKDCMMGLRQKTLLFIADNEPVDLIQISMGVRVDRKTAWEYVKDLWTLRLIEERTMDEWDDCPLSVPVDEVLSNKRRYSRWQLNEKGNELVQALRG